jgi:hypothetical protein
MADAIIDNPILSSLLRHPSRQRRFGWIGNEPELVQAPVLRPGPAT